MIICYKINKNYKRQLRLKKEDRERHEKYEKTFRAPLSLSLYIALSFLHSTRRGPFIQVHRKQVRNVKVNTNESTKVDAVNYIFNPLIM